MEILQDRAGDAAIVVPVGRLDSASASLLRATLQKLDTAGERRILVDLAGVDYISSAALGVLFALAKRMRAVDGALAICSLGDQVRRVFEIAGYTSHFTVTATRDEAVAHVTSRPR